MNVIQFKPIPNTFDENCQVNYMFITCMLKGALPTSIIRDLKLDYAKSILQVENCSNLSTKKQRLYKERKRYIYKVDKLLDSRKVRPQFMKYPEIRLILKELIISQFNPTNSIVALSILPNHFHLLINNEQFIVGDEKRYDITGTCKQLSETLERIKYLSEERINPIIGRRGRFWDKECFDLTLYNGRCASKVQKYIVAQNIYTSLKESYSSLAEQSA